jgi:hypothetical protein
MGKVTCSSQYFCCQLGPLVDLVADVGYNHPIVQKIMCAAEKAKDDDDTLGAYDEEDRFALPTKIQYLYMLLH